MVDVSTILIVSNIDETIDKLKATLPKHHTRIIRNIDDSKDEFLIVDAQRAIKEAYLATNEPKYIILCGSIFRIEAQNSLLKVLEEPPKNIIFILVTQSKSAILPTIFSRLPHKFLQEKKTISDVPLDIKNLDLKQTYLFLKQNQRISKSEAKELIEALLYKIHKEHISLDKKQLDSFSTALKLINLNSRPINVLTSLLLNLNYTNSKRLYSKNASL